MLAIFSRVATEKSLIILKASADFVTDVSVPGDQFCTGKSYSCEYLRDITNNARITDRGETYPENKPEVKILRDCPFQNMTPLNTELSSFMLSFPYLGATYRPFSP